MNIPKHIAIIMDGNGRWAKRRHLPRIEGHRAGARALRRTMDAAIELGVKYLTVYAFSVDNWKRSKEEVDDLMNLMRRFIRENFKDLVAKQIRLIVIGRMQGLPEDIIEEIERITTETANNDKLNLILAFNYGSHSEIIDGIRALYQDIQNGKKSIDDINEADFCNYLYTKGIPDPDLLIRTSDEMRLSNFLLWQLSYSELWFTPIHWPDFKKKHLEQAIVAFNKRERRFGGRK